MNAANKQWSDADLDAYRDGALLAGQADNLRRALLADASLRARLTRLERGDAMMHAALIAPRRIVRRADGVRLGFWTTGIAAVAAAAALVLFVANPWRGSVQQDSPESSGAANALAPQPDDLPTNSADAIEPYQSVRVVMVLPSRASTKTPREPKPTTVTAPAVEPPNPTTLAFNRALAENRVADAASLLIDASEPQREAGLKRMGDTIRSAMTAESVLERLPPEQQVEACSIWARDLELRPVALRRLAELQNREATAADVRRVARELHDDVQIRPWLRSYGVRSPT